MNIVADFWQGIQGILFGAETLWQKPLTDREKSLVAILNVVRVEEHIKTPRSITFGRPLHPRGLIARAFVAKAAWNYASTKMFREALIAQDGLRLICGWHHPGDVPSESTLSRAFTEFAATALGSKVHKHLVTELVGDQPILHLSRDSTELPAREKAARKKIGARIRTHEATLPDGRVIRGTRLEIQRAQTLQEMLEDLPKACDAAKKKDSNGNMHTLIGYKLHIDWADGMVPISAVLTSASVHDTQAAIPLIRMSSQRATILYELMDQAYDAAAIRAEVEEKGHVALIDRQKSRKNYRSFDPAEALRYGNRTNSERGNSRLKDSFGFRHLRVRGHQKALFHAMMGLLALFADQIVKTRC